MSMIYSYIKMHENQCSGSKIVPCRQMAGPPHKTKLIVTVRNFAKAPKNPCSLPKDDEVS